MTQIVRRATLSDFGQCLSIPGTAEANPATGERSAAQNLTTERESRGRRRHPHHGSCSAVVEGPVDSEEPRGPPKDPKSNAKRSCKESQRPDGQLGQIENIVQGEIQKLQARGPPGWEPVHFHSHGPPLQNTSRSLEMRVALTWHLQIGCSEARPRRRVWSKPRWHFGTLRDNCHQDDRLAAGRPAALPELWLPGG
ncbi:hypothetical protein ColTof3_01021 [Colletotrichum tofieldiae]|nr:hypothetical protein ColTof3_01021 [Colletotrichum tofieldiae]